MTYFRERLWPAPWIFLALALVIPASLLVFLPIDVIVGVVVGVGLYAGFVALLLAGAPTIEVTEQHLRAGRAALPLEYAGEVRTFEGADATRARGPELDARAWLLIRGWVSPVVTVEVTDPADPTPYWLLSTRQPAQLADAVQRAKATAG